jgi:ABC-type multidrug transport system ATPase subunit
VDAGLGLATQLITLLRPDGGHDVVRQAAAVRRCIGLAGQSAAIQPELTGWENLEIIGRLYRLSRPDARSRRPGCWSSSASPTRPAGTYSGGMQRRLDLAASLAGRACCSSTSRGCVGGYLSG